MLGFGISEIILIVIVGIIVLGPDRLPNALIEMAKFVRVVKRTMQDAKDTLDREVNLAEIKKEAQAYKDKLEHGVDISKDIKGVSLEIQKDMNDIQHLFKDYNPRTVQLDIQENDKQQSTSGVTLESKIAQEGSIDSLNKADIDSNPTKNTSHHVEATHKVNHV